MNSGIVSEKEKKHTIDKQVHAPHALGTSSCPYDFTWRRRKKTSTPKLAETPSYNTCQHHSSIKKHFDSSIPMHTETMARSQHTPSASMKSMGQLTLSPQNKQRSRVCLNPVGSSPQGRKQQTSMASRGKTATCTCTLGNTRNTPSKIKGYTWSAGKLVHGKKAPRDSLTSASSPNDF